MKVVNIFLGASELWAACGACSFSVFLCLPSQRTNVIDVRLLRVFVLLLRFRFLPLLPLLIHGIHVTADVIRGRDAPGGDGGLCTIAGGLEAGGLGLGWCVGVILDRDLGIELSWRLRLG